MSGCYPIESDLEKRIKKLEEAHHADYETAKEIIFAGAQTHASILKLEAKIKELESKENEKGKKPYKCPVCYGEGKSLVHHEFMQPFETRIIDSAGRHYVACRTCEGRGIVWG